MLTDAVLQIMSVNHGQTSFTNRVGVAFIFKYIEMKFRVKTIKHSKYSLILIS